MQKDSLVSIVTVFYNRSAAVAESIQSLLDQTYRNLEIVAVDDGSQDDTLIALQAFKDPRYRVIAKENSGFTRSLNFAIAQASGEYVAIHDAGDISHPDRVKRQAEALDGNPSVGIVGCWVEQESIYGGVTKILDRKADKQLHEIISVHNTFTHGEVMFRRSVFDAVGGYRPYFYFAQDRDLWVRMSRVTSHTVVPEILYRQKVFRDGVMTTPDKKLLQSYLSDFAVQCGESVDDDGRDLIDRYGEHAAFFRKRSRRLARKLVGIGVRWMMVDPIEARTFLDAAHAEYPSLHTNAARLVCMAAAIPGLRRGTSRLMPWVVAWRESSRKRNNARKVARLRKVANESP